MPLLVIPFWMHEQVVCICPCPFMYSSTFFRDCIRHLAYLDKFFLCSPFIGSDLCTFLVEPLRKTYLYFPVSLLDWREYYMSRCTTCSRCAGIPLRVTYCILLIIYLLIFLSLFLVLHLRWLSRRFFSVYSYGCLHKWLFRLFPMGAWSRSVCKSMSWFTIWSA